MMLQPDQTILNGKYRIARLIGQGGMAQVWLAEEIAFNQRRVALKLPRPDLPDGSRADLYARFDREIRVCALLDASRAPQVVRAITADRLGDTQLLSLVYMPGGDLATQIARHPQGLPLEQTLAIVRDLLAALAAAHGHPLEIVHRDVKPANILFDGEGRAHLADFGLAQSGASLDSRLQQAEAQVGTPRYMAPEQARQAGYVTPAADIYSLGCVLFEMLTGKPYKRLRPGTPPSAQRGDLPVWVDGWTLKAVAEDPYDRYGEAGEMLAALDAAVARPSAVPPAPSERGAPPKATAAQPPAAPRRAGEDRLAALAREAEEKEHALAREAEALEARLAAERAATAQRLAQMAAERKAEAEAAAREAALRARIEAAERERAALRAKEEAARLGLPPGLVELGLELVKIPAGEFLYGDRKEKRRTGEYWLGKTPVTNAQYKAFVDATGHGKPEHWQGGGIPKGKERHPVTKVSWEDARAFCRWAGVRLPREEEWEKGARGTDGREYPWGNQKPEQSLCNFGRNVGDTTPVGQYPKGASPYGLLDMAGNVWEWCEDAWEGDAARRVVRGGSWSYDGDFVRAADRNWVDTDLRNDLQGFRVALSPQL